MKYLIVGPSWVGDMVMSQSLYITLKTLAPNAIIDVLAPAWSRPIIERMPQVRRSIVMPVGHGQMALRLRKNIGQSLQEEHYNHAIVLPNSFKSALIPWWAKIPVRTGWHGEMRYGLINDRRKLDKFLLPRMVDRYVALAYPANSAITCTAPAPNLHVPQAQKEETLNRYGLALHRPVLGLCPGAEFGPSKQWPVGYYGEVADIMLEKGWQVWLFGSKNDRNTTECIRECIPDTLQPYCHNLAGKTSLADAVNLLASTHAVVSNDSGLMHIAAALNRPLVAIYGSTSATHTPPMNNNNDILTSELKCSPCFKRECPLKHHNCMKQLVPGMVIASLDRLTRSSDQGGAL
ncbi:ADP-heptose--LPS heptosyltransferase 2 [invertebrate metagenome]|uniref:lipopolysaccharide heptosyltransferase II n=1 Tax=invertebrate metagenome TaxID=1711999 RepID=A0A2H9T654_9ZZZZ